MQKPKIITQTHATLLSHVLPIVIPLDEQSIFKASISNEYLSIQANEKHYLDSSLRHHLVKENFTNNQKLRNNPLSISNILLQTLQMCDLVRLNRKNKSVQIIDFPTVRVQSKHTKKLNQAQSYITDKGIRVSAFQIYQGNGDFLFTVYKQHAWNLIQQGFSKQKQKIPYYKSLLLDQIKDGVGKFKKTKKQQLNMQQRDKFSNYNYSYQNNYTGYNNGYNFNQLDKPQIFIRRAIESDSEDQQVQKMAKQMRKIEISDKTNGQNQSRKTDSDQKARNGKVTKSGKNGQEVKRKYKEPIKVVLNDDDFPALS